MQKARCHGTKPIQPLVGARFQGLFHSSVRGSFHLSLTVLFAIGHWVVFSLGGWAPLLQTGFHVSGPTLVSLLHELYFAYGEFALYVHTFQYVRLYISCPLSDPQPQSLKRLVWALSRSLAATRKIDVSFSS